MSYWDDWYAGLLGANQVSKAVIVDGTNELDVTQYVGNENFIFNRGSSEDIYDSFSQDTLTIELNNSTHRFDDYVFKGKKLKIDITTSDIYEEHTYNSDFYNLLIIGATTSDDYVSLETVVMNMGESRLSWYYLGAKTDLDPFTSIGIVFGNAVGHSGITYWSGLSGFANDNVPLPSYHFDWNDYLSSALDSISTNGEMFTRLCQILGGFCYLDKGDSVPFLNIKHFPKTVLSSEVSSYVYGGTYDEVSLEPTRVEDFHIPKNDVSEEIDVSDYKYIVFYGEHTALTEVYMDAVELPHEGTDITEKYIHHELIDVSEYDSITLESNTSIWTDYILLTPYSTGDDLDGNVDTKDGGSFTVDYKVLDDNVLSAYQINSDYYRPTGIKGIVPCWKNENNEWKMEDKEVVYGTSSGALDLTGNAILKMIIFRNATTESQYPSIFSDIYDEINFPSVRFEATIPNNLKFALGDVIALSGGVGPTRFSFIENINTDISGPTILSNNRGGEK